MSWRDCIQSAADAGRITQAKADAAKAAFDERKERLLAEGVDDATAELTAADAATQQLTTLNKEKRWQRIKEMQAAKGLHDRLMRSDQPWRELEYIIQDLENAYDTTRGFAMANLDRMMRKYKPQAGGFVITKKGMDDIVRARFGLPAPAEAKEMADALGESQELLRKLANQAGASIPESKNAYLFQTHDQVRVSSVPMETWVDEHLAEGVLDWEAMRYAGKAIDEADRRAVLERTYRGIVTDGADRGLEAQGNTPNLANRLNRDRFLHYASADAWLEMQGKYGAGDLYQQTIGMIDAMSKDISLMRVFGPNADSMKEFVKRTAEKRAGDMDLAAGANQRKFLTKTRRQLAVFQDEYDIHARHTPSLEGNLAMQTFSAIRTVAVGAKLGGVFIPSVGGDLSNAKVARRMFNLPEARVFREYWSNFAPTEENIADAIRLGVIFENGISLASSRQRYFGALDGPHWARRFSDIVYRSGLAAHHTQVIRNSEGKMFLGILAKHANMEFDDLPFAAMLTEVGITPADWDTMRSIPLHNIRGATFMRPMDALGTAPDVAQKFGDLLQLYVRTAVPDTTLRSRAAQGEAIDPNTVKGQFMRTMTSLMSFPISIYFNQLRRIAETPGIRNKTTLIANYAIWTMLGGMFITQAKALWNGQNPMNMSLLDDEQPLGINWDFYGRSFVNGGTMGILGDFIFNNINVSNSNYTQDDPTTALFKAAHKATLDNVIDAGSGEDLEVGKDLYNLADELVPKLWFMKLIMQRSIQDELMRQVDPAGYARRRKYEQEYESGQWWGMNDEPSAPDISTAVS